MMEARRLAIGDDMSPTAVTVDKYAGVKEIAGLLRSFQALSRTC